MSEGAAPATRPAARLGKLGGETPWAWVLLSLVGAGTGLFASLVLYGTKTVWLALLVAGVLALIPTFALRDPRPYWLGLFLFIIQFEIKKNLNDGLSIVRAYDIDYTLYNFTFEVRGSDLVFLVLAFLWLHDVIFRKQKLRLPRATWLAVAYLALCLLSLVGARWPYLGIVELVRQSRFLVFFLYAYNNLCSTKWLRLIAAAAIAILALQGAVTAGRYVFEFYDPIAFGESHQDEGERDRYLQIERGPGVSGIATRRAFGTGTSPGSTGKLCLMVIPFALLCCLRNPLLRGQLVITLILAASLGALVLTFARSFYAAAGVELAAGFLIALWRGYLPRSGALLIVALGLAAAAFAFPKVYETFSYRWSAVDVRFAQYSSSIAQIKAHPLRGVGFNNGTGLKREYVVASFDPTDPASQSHSEPTHNLYLALAADIGIPGALCFVAFFAVVVRAAWRLARASRDPSAAFFANAVLVVFAGVATVTMGDPFHEDAVLALTWMYSGIILGFYDAEFGPRSRSSTLA